MSFAYDPSDRITNPGYTYDANGTLLADGMATYEYDAANRLIQTTRSGVVTTYGYDGWGNLIQDTVNGVTTEFVLDENTAYTRILGEIRSDGGERLYAYGAEGFSAQQAVGGGIEYPLLDGLGSVRQLTDASGTVILTRSYDAYGAVRLATGTGSTRLGYTGEMQDAISGLVYLRARHYYPVLGRFLQRDSFDGAPQLPQSFNRYSYAHNNPLGNVDPSGHDPLDPTWRTEFRRSHGGRAPTAEDVLIRLYSIAFPHRSNPSRFYDKDGDYIDGSIESVFGETGSRSWKDIPDALEKMADWYQADEGYELTRDIGSLFGGLLNRLEQPDSWAAFSFPQNPARAWVRVGKDGVPRSLTGNDPDGNIHHWGWAVVFGSIWGFNVCGELLNMGREISQLQPNQYASPPDDFYADIAIGNAGVVFGRRVEKNGGRSIRQDFQETMDYWANYFGD